MMVDYVVSQKQKDRKILLYEATKIVSCFL